MPDHFCQRSASRSSAAQDSATVQTAGSERSCPLCSVALRWPDAFCDDHRGTIAAIEWANAQMPPPPEHAPGHPYGAQPGPNGLWARWRKRDDCDWRQNS